MTEGYQMMLSVDYLNGMFGVFKPSRLLKIPLRLNE